MSNALQMEFDGNIRCYSVGLIIEVLKISVLCTSYEITRFSHLLHHGNGVGGELERTWE